MRDERQKTLSEEGRDNWDKIFRRKEKESPNKEKPDEADKREE